jgi:hypothetical protein
MKRKSTKRDSLAKRATTRTRTPESGVAPSRQAAISKDVKSTSGNAKRAVGTPPRTALKGGPMSIRAEKNQFDDAFLDIVGSEFKFDHAKGIAEWIKNSVDAYMTTTDVPDAEQHLLLRFKIGVPKKNSVFECVDFVGMKKQNIDKALKVWGLRDASKRGKNVATYGGHGNGGKFYMRQMFDKSHFITYRDGLLNVFGFDEGKKYGYAQGFEDCSVTLEAALKFARLDHLKLPESVKERWSTNPDEAGFTVVRGEGPHRFSGKATIKTILERLRTHPQARRILRHVPVVYLAENDTFGTRLTLPVIDPREGFEEPRVYTLPKKLIVDGEDVDISALKGGVGKLTLWTSGVPLSRSSEFAAMNTIDVLGQVGCIGSYRMNELGGFLRFSAESEFIYGEFEAAFLEDRDAPHDSVANDREKLHRNPLTDALLNWVRECVDDLAGAMAERRDNQKRSQDLRVSSAFNQLLNTWKDGFMEKLTGELFGGRDMGESFGGSGGGGAGGDGAAGANSVGKLSNSKKDSAGGDETGPGSGDKGADGGGAGDERRKGPTFPRVLLSSLDQDPLSELPSQLDLDERHPPVYQRAEDISANIFWINTSRALATRIIDTYTVDSPRWREYMFQRYLEIIIKVALYQMAARDADLTAEKIDGMLDKVISRVHDAAAQELSSFLFDTRLVSGIASPEAVEQLGESPSDEAYLLEEST